MAPRPPIRPRPPAPRSSSSSPTRELEQSRANRRMLQAARALQAQGRARTDRGARPVRALPRLPDRHRRRAGGAGGGQARRLAAPDPLVQHAAAAQALARRRAGLRLGLRARRHRVARQGPLAGRDHRRPRGLVPARQLQPLLLRRLPAALRADRGAVRHALPAAAPAARRAQGERGRARRARRDAMRSGSPTIPPGRRSTRRRTASECAVPPSARPTDRVVEPPDGAQRLADRPAHLPRRRGDRGAGGEASRARLDHRLSRRRHPDRARGG